MPIGFLLPNRSEAHTTYEILWKKLSAGVQEYLTLRSIKLDPKEKMANLKAVFNARRTLGFFRHQGDEGMIRATNIKNSLDFMKKNKISLYEQELTALLFAIYESGATGLMSCITPRLIFGGLIEKDGKWEHYANSEVFKLTDDKGALVNTGCPNDKYNAETHIRAILKVIRNEMAGTELNQKIEEFKTGFSHNPDSITSDSALKKEPTTWEI
ncbi:MAG: hypothetical protein NTU49_05295 [Gammaproteobacteria bacterium]|nr:hypothetical protein [Gammaproteobacteria bacterium]